jgi:hypothetical protein
LRVTVNGRLIFRAGAAALRYFEETARYRVPTYPVRFRIAGTAARAGRRPDHARTAQAQAQAREEIVPIYRALVDEVMFLLVDVLEVARHDNLPGFAEAPPDLVLAVLREAAISISTASTSFD